MANKKPQIQTLKTLGSSSAGVIYEQVGEEELLLGDVWAANDPNELRTVGPDVQVKMRALKDGELGKIASRIGSSGGFWRPVAIVV